MIFGGRKIFFLVRIRLRQWSETFIVKTSPLIISLSVLWILKAVYRKTNPLLHSIFVFFIIKYTQNKLLLSPREQLRFVVVRV